MSAKAWFTLLTSKEEVDLAKDILNSSFEEYDTWVNYIVRYKGGLMVAWTSEGYAIEELPPEILEKTELLDNVAVSKKRAIEKLAHSEENLVLSLKDVYKMDFDNDMKIRTDVGGNDIET